MSDDEHKDSVARYSAERANERVTEHIEMCAIHYEEIARNFENNANSHKELMSKVDSLKDDLHKYDMRAIVRWISFGGAFIFLTVGHLFKVYG